MGWVGRALEAHLPPSLYHVQGPLQPDQTAHLINEYMCWKMFEVLKYVFTDKLFTYRLCFKSVYLEIIFLIILSRGWGHLVLQR